jgi:hypothetical protein
LAVGLATGLAVDWSEEAIGGAMSPVSPHPAAADASSIAASAGAVPKITRRVGLSTNLELHPSSLPYGIERSQDRVGMGL